MKRFINCADTVKFYVFREVVESPVLPQSRQYLVKIKLATVKTADFQTIRLTFANVKQSPTCLCDTSLLQCHLQEVPLHEILYVSVYIRLMLIGFGRASKDTL